MKTLFKILLTIAVLGFGIVFTDYALTYQPALVLVDFMFIIIIVALWVEAFADKVSNLLQNLEN